MNGDAYDYVMDQLAKRKGSWRVMANDSGIPYETIRNIGMRRTRPLHETVMRLYRYLVSQVPSAPAESAQ